MRSRGQEAAVRAAVLATSGELLAFFQRRTDEPEDAADLLAETMMLVWRKADSLPLDQEYQRRWLFTLARNVLSHHWRSERRRSSLVRRLGEHLATRQPVEDDPAQVLAVREAVGRLPVNQRLLLTLVHWEGFSIVDAAEICGLNASTARGRYAAARTALARQLDWGENDDRDEPTRGPHPSVSAVSAVSAVSRG